MAKWTVIANEYNEYHDEQCWLIMDDDHNVFDVRTSGHDSTAQDAFAFREDGGELGGKIMAWHYRGKRS